MAAFTIYLLKENKHPWQSHYFLEYALKITHQKTDKKLKTEVLYRFASEIIRKVGGVLLNRLGRISGDAMIAKWQLYY